MITGALKSVLFAALAVLLSAGHSVCAGMVEEAAPGAEHQHHAASVHGNHVDQADARYGRIPAPEKSAPGGPHQHDCQHCKSAKAYKASVNSATNASLAAAPIEKTVSAFFDAQINNMRVTGMTRFTDLSRGPPKATPISLKIRLLI